MTLSRSAFLVALVAALVGSLTVGPAGAADDPRAEREAAREKRVALAQDLDLVRASEQELADAVAALDEQVSAKTAELDAARQAVEAAEAELADEKAILAEQQAEIDDLKSVLVDRAVEAFIHPDETTLDDVVGSADIAEAARKQALLGRVAARDADVIDQLRTVQIDFEATMASAKEAQRKAEERRAEVTDDLAELEEARAEQARAREALQSREAALVAEIDAQRAAEAELTRIIGDNAGPVGADGAIGAGGCAWPADGPVTSEYGSRWGRLHAGLDIGAPTGAPIRAVKTGTVIFAGTQSGYGNTVIVDHGGGFTTLYAHQSRIGTSNGARVSQGQVIGYVGSTGQSTGPHLHFETRYGGSPRNPRSCL